LALPGDKFYRYFGRAKELPGVKELFSQQMAPQVKKSRFEMLRSIDPSYYGYGEDDDYSLVEEEVECEKKGKKKYFD
jgi:pre-mRNA-splicing factor ISY1